jgi:acyl-coenzyme A thioesterase PaaI-like protein
VTELSRTPAATAGPRHDPSQAVPLSQGRSQQLWRVDITDESGKLIAHGEVRLQNVEGQAAD